MSILEYALDVNKEVSEIISLCESLDINKTNEYYRFENIALIYKKPTPIQVVQVEYPKNRIKVYWCGK